MVVQTKYDSQAGYKKLPLTGLPFSSIKLALCEKLD
jgi:hypothetical protein